MITIGYVEPGNEESFGGLYDEYELLSFGKQNSISSLDEAKAFIRLASAHDKPQWPYNSRTIYIFENEIQVGTVRPQKK
jgi:hypothetical protein